MRRYHYYVVVKRQDSKPETLRPAGTKMQMMERAQIQLYSRAFQYTEVWRRGKDHPPTLLLRYWLEGKQLQYIEYEGKGL